jgi:hypothetical protein
MTPEELIVAAKAAHQSERPPWIKPLIGTIIYCTGVEETIIQTPRSQYQAVQEVMKLAGCSIHEPGVNPTDRSEAVLIVQRIPSLAACLARSVVPGGVTVWRLEYLGLQDIGNGRKAHDWRVNGFAPDDAGVLGTCVWALDPLDLQGPRCFARVCDCSKVEGCWTFDPPGAPISTEPPKKKGRK